MKKIIATMLVAAASMGSTAMAGDWYAGGNIGFMHESQNGYTTNTFSILPEVGYNFSEMWSFGGQIGYTYRNWAGHDTNLNLFQINPYARWSFFRTSNNLIQLFVDGSVGFGAGATSVRGDKSDTAITWEIGLKPGIAFNVTEHFSIVAHVGFLGYHGANDAAKTGGEKEYGGVNFDSRNLNFGLYYTF